MSNYDDESKYTVKHQYDDISELNHPAPMWWQLIFYGSIVWAAGYFAYYEFMDGPSLRKELEQSLTQIEAEKLKNGGGGPSEDQLLALVKDQEALKKGKEVFIGKCASCHGNEGQGVIGPNLTDNFWIHGKGTAVDIFKTVQTGVAEKGMPPWGPILTADEMKNTVAFVKSLAGTKPANPKAPQGTEIK